MLNKTLTDAIVAKEAIKKDIEQKKDIYDILSHDLDNLNIMKEDDDIKRHEKNEDKETLSTKIDYDYKDEFNEPHQVSLTRRDS